MGYREEEGVWCTGSSAVTRNRNDDAHADEGPAGC